MSTIRQALYGAALIAALGLLIYLQQHRLESTAAARATAEARAEQADRDNAARQQLVNQLEQSLRDERLAQAELRTQQQEIRQQLISRQQVIKELTHENQMLRDWAATELPASAQGLRRRPAITGAASYQAWLSGSDPVRAVGDQPDPQRRPAD